ncbi:MAG: hypothetical protein A2X86_09875 [Bdellovibrionales bacterium GWA2_49_15]|nr:MAG: hypothetical protein A2X86_09875 [Bdellovibrionales bacterium GWA2_49_15]HAZ13091.1 hypothetical protein [Bdellovibrionales bacterium]
MIQLLQLSIFFALLCLADSAHASKKIISSSKPLPTEFILLLESVQRDDLSDKSKVQFEQWIISLDESFGVLTKDEIFFLCKAEIYKAILKKYRNSETDLKKFNLYFLKTAVAKVEQVNREKVALSLFSKWMIQALLSDLKSLLTAPQNLNFITFVQNGTDVTSPAFIIWSKKMKMVAPWVDLFINSVDSEFESIVRPIQLEALQTIAIYADLLLKQSRFKDAWPKKKSTLTGLSFFNWKELQETKEPAIIANEPLLPQGSGSSEAPPAAWTPKDTPDAITSSKLPPNYPTPNPDYLPPDRLPQPVNDWIQAQ